MPSGFDPDHGLPTLWADAPDAAVHLRALYATGVEPDDLVHSIEHGWLLWEKALDETQSDRFIDDLHNLHTRPGYFVATDFAHERSKRRPGAEPDHAKSIDNLYVKLRTARQACTHNRIARFLTVVFQAKPLAFQQLVLRQTAACREMDSLAGPRRGHRRTCLRRRQSQAVPTPYSPMAGSTRTARRQTSDMPRTWSASARRDRPRIGLCSLGQLVYRLPKLSEVIRPMPIWDFYD